MTASLNEPREEVRLVKEIDLSDPFVDPGAVLLRTQVSDFPEIGGCHMCQGSLLPDDRSPAVRRETAVFQ